MLHTTVMGPCKNLDRQCTRVHSSCPESVAIKSKQQEYSFPSFKEAQKGKRNAEFLYGVSGCKIILEGSLLHLSEALLNHQANN